MKFCSLHGTSKEKYIFAAVQNVVKECGEFYKLSTVCHVGCMPMIEINSFVGPFGQKKTDVPTLQYIVHQMALSAKHMNLNNAMVTMVIITN